MDDVGQDRYPWFSACCHISSSQEEFLREAPYVRPNLAPVLHRVEETVPDPVVVVSDEEETAPVPVVVLLSDEEEFERQSHSRDSGSQDEVEMENAADLSRDDSEVFGIRFNTASIVPLQETGEDIQICRLNMSPSVYFQNEIEEDGFVPDIQTARSPLIAETELPCNHGKGVALTKLVDQVRSTAATSNAMLKKRKLPPSFFAMDTAGQGKSRAGEIRIEISGQGSGKNADNTTGQGSSIAGETRIVNSGQGSGENDDIPTDTTGQGSIGAEETRMVNSGQGSGQNDDNPTDTTGQGSNRAEETRIVNSGQGSGENDDIPTDTTVQGSNSAEETRLVNSGLGSGENDVIPTDTTGQGSIRAEETRIVNSGQGIGEIPLGTGECKELTFEEIRENILQIYGSLAKRQKLVHQEKVVVIEFGNEAGVTAPRLSWKPEDCDDTLTGTTDQGSSRAGETSRVNIGEGSSKNDDTPTCTNAQGSSKAGETHRVNIGEGSSKNDDTPTCTTAQGSSRAGETHRVNIGEGSGKNDDTPTDTTGQESSRAGEAHIVNSGEGSGEKPLGTEYKDFTGEEVTETIMKVLDFLAKRQKPVSKDKVDIIGSAIKAGFTFPQPSWKPEDSADDTPTDTAFGESV